MAFCKNCGTQLTDGVKFCGNCGAKVENTTSGNSQRKTMFDGEIHKCPNCGEILKAFETVCPSCKHELRGTTTSNTVKDFAMKLEKTHTETERIYLIKSFYVPNTKEDITEFFIYAISNLNLTKGENEAWKVKLDQAYHKAKLAFGNSTEFAYIHNLYTKTIKKIKSQQLKSATKNVWKIILSIIIGIIALLMILAGISIVDGPDDPYYMLIMFGMMLGLSIIPINIPRNKGDNSNHNDNDTKN